MYSKWQSAVTILKEDETLIKFKNGAYNQALNFDINKIVPKYIKLYESAMINT